MKDNAIKEILVFIVGILMLYCLYDQKQDKELRLELSDLNNDYKTLDSIYHWKSERLKSYVEIDLEQSKLIPQKDKPQRLRELEYSLTEKKY